MAVCSGDVQWRAAGWGCSAAAGLRPAEYGGSAARGPGAPGSRVCPRPLQLHPCTTPCRGLQTASPSSADAWPGSADAGMQQMYLSRPLAEALQPLGHPCRWLMYLQSQEAMQRASSLQYYTMHIVSSKGDLPHPLSQSNTFPLVDQRPETSLIHQGVLNPHLILPLIK